MSVSRYVFHVEEIDQGLSLQQFLQYKLKGQYSNKSIKNWIEGQSCTINGRLERFGSMHLVEGDSIEFVIPLAKSPEDIPILFEDNFFIAIDKPAHLVCEDQVIQTVFPGTCLIHRLDKDTTGVLLLAKSEEVKQRFIDLFREQLVKKTYLAVVTGIPRQKSGKIQNYLFAKPGENRQKRWKAQKKPPGLYAETHWKVLQAVDRYSLILCWPKTGRTHQLRVHLQGLGCPIMGDALYGSSANQIVGVAHRQLLHAWKLEFDHPYSGKKMALEAKLPEDFVAACSSLDLKTP